MLQSPTMPSQAAWESIREKLHRCLVLCPHMTTPDIQRCLHSLDLKPEIAPLSPGPQLSTLCSDRNSGWVCRSRVGTVWAETLAVHSPQPSRSGRFLPILMAWWQESCRCQTNDHSKTGRGRFGWTHLDGLAPPRVLRDWCMMCFLGGKHLRNKLAKAVKCWTDDYL